MRLVIFLLSFCCIIGARAQQLPAILDNSGLKRGIYMSFDEFLRNDPSIGEDFQILLKGSEASVEKGVANYKLVLSDSIKTNTKRRNIWGVSDGSHVYINELPYAQQYNFKRIHQLGRYCYFRGSVPATGGAMFGLAGALAVELSSDLGYALNINNGKIFTVNKNLMTIILEKDPDLLSRYEQEDKKGIPETMFAYLDEYNAKYWMEASPDYFRPIEVILYRTGKKESAESVRVVINDTATHEMTRNASYSFRNHAEAMKVCSDGRCIDIDLIKKRTNYIQCSLRDKGELRCERVSEKEGEFYSQKAPVLSGREKGSESTMP